MTEKWQDWVDYWEVDFDYEYKREIIRVAAEFKAGHPHIGGVFYRVELFPAPCHPRSDKLCDLEEAKADFCPGRDLRGSVRSFLMGQTTWRYGSDFWGLDQSRRRTRGRC